MITKSPWISSGIIHSIHTKHRLFKKYKENHSVYRKHKYTRYKNILTAVIRKAKELYFSDQINNCKNDKGGMWKVLSAILKKSNCEHTTDSFLSGDIIVQDKKAIVEDFNNYFASVANDLVSKIPASNINASDFLQNLKVSHTLFLFPTTHAEIMLIINYLKNGKSAGYDNITSNVLKQIANTVIEPLTYLINLSFVSGVFPSELKVAKIIPIHKAGDRNKYTNYRPISLLPVISKLIERLIHNRLMNFISKHSIFNDNQYGFRKNYSTYMAAIKLTESICEWL